MEGVRGASNGQYIYGDPGATFAFGFLADGLARVGESGTPNGCIGKRDFGPNGESSTCLGPRVLALKLKGCSARGLDLRMGVSSYGKGIAAFNGVRPALSSKANGSIALDRRASRTWREGVWNGPVERFLPTALASQRQQ